MRRLVPAALVVLTACSGGSHPLAPVTSAGTGAPAANAPPSAGFVALGDFGGGSRQGAVAKAIGRWVAQGHRVDALVTTGDNVYDAGQPDRYAAQLDAPYATLRDRRPMWATLGNHDEQAGHGSEELRHLGLPPLPYAQSLPGVQLLFLDANRPDAAQAQWLDARLSEPGPPFRVVVFHQPAWSCANHGSTPAVDDQWVPVLERHRVALVLNGHDHVYERFTSAAGVSYVVTGGGGQGLYQILTGCRTAPRMQASAVRHHFVGVEVGPGTLTLTAVADDGTVLDRAVITR